MNIASEELLVLIIVSEDDSKIAIFEVREAVWKDMF